MKQMILYEDIPVEEGRLPREMAVYRLLGALGIPFKRMDHKPVATIEACRGMDQALGIHMCKNLFLCNRQQTDFYLLMMPGDKPFKTKDLSPLLGCSRLSFASADHMRDYLNTVPGSVSALELLFDTEQKVRLVIDKALLEDTYISGHPAISTSTLRLKREDLLRFVEAVGHTPTVIDLPDPRNSLSFSEEL